MGINSSGPNNEHQQCLAVDGTLRLLPAAAVQPLGNSPVGRAGGNPSDRYCTFHHIHAHSMYVRTWVNAAVTAVNMMPSPTNTYILSVYTYMHTVCCIHTAGHTLGRNATGRIYATQVASLLYEYRVVVSVFFQR